MIALLIGCTAGVEDAPERPLAWPHAGLIVDGRVALDADALPSAATPLPVDHVAWREGFSVAQTTVFELPVTGALPSLGDIGAAGSVRLIDLGTGHDLPMFAELDAWPDGDEEPLLLVRPLTPMPVGAEVAVVVTTDAAEVTPFWAADGDPELAQALADLGVDDVAMATSFPIADGTAPTRHVTEAVSIPTEWAWSSIVDDPEHLPPGIAKKLKGRFVTDSWLSDEGTMALDADGIPTATGTLEADLRVYVPDRAAAADPGTVPIWIFGHGIFAHPDGYLDEDDDPNGVIALANEAGAIVVATTWRGLTTSDLGVAIAAGNDFAKLRNLGDHMVQGVANTRALVHLVQEGGLRDDAELDGLPDADTLRYYGISLGGIEGAVLVANTPELPAAVLHVGGSSWSTMLERSSNWTQFEELMAYGVPSPADRQHLYAVSQLYWDPIDPAGYASDLSDRTVLWQEAIGDEQVPNLTTRAMIRGVGGVTQLEPVVENVYGIDSDAAPAAPAYVQYDPEVGLPAEENRPAPVSGAHGAPRTWAGTTHQTVRFLDPDDPGVVEHYCGDTPCSASNSGSWIE